MIKLDHIAVAANTVEEGIEYFKDVYSLEVSAGGQHLAMGTHNAVMKLDNDQYLEIIAIDPRGKKPGRPRWFDLDSVELAEKIKEKPKLITWVARTDSFEGLKKISTVDIGTARAMTRGDLSWRFGFTDDGSLINGGLLPYIIEWDDDEHVSRKLPEKGYELAGLELSHPHPNKIKEQLTTMGLVNNNTITIKQDKTPSLKACIRTKNGIVEIG